MERSSYAIWVQLDDESGAIVYAGEAIYRPSKPDPRNNAFVPQVGIPDDAIRGHLAASVAYRLWFNGEVLAVTGVYLERISTCWWLLLDRPPAHPPTV